MLDKRYLTLALLAKTKSYTATAKQLFMTQPAVSQQIASLEAELALKLVNYEHQTLQITAAGKNLVEFVDKTQSEANKLMKLLNSEMTQRTLKIGSTRSLAIFLLPDLIQQIDQANQNIQTIIGNTDDVLTALRNGQIDFGLIEGNFDKVEFDAIKIKNEPFIGVTKKKLQSERVTIEELFDQPLLIRESGSGTRDIFKSWLATQNFELNDFDRQIEVASPMSITTLLKKGVGISFMYESLVKEAIDRHELRQIHIRDFNIHHPLNLVYLKNSYFADEYQQFAQLLN
ncbi:LysR substrate-binding domain-containing protein [Paucilactobacillus sp. N302-9]